MTNFKAGYSSKGSTLIGDEPDSKERTSGPMGYSYDISSNEKLEFPKPTMTRKIRESNFVRRKGGWKRLLLIVLVLIIFLTAIVVGVVVGLGQQKKKNSNNDDNGDGTSGPTQEGSTNTIGVIGAAGASPSGTAGVGSSPSSTNVPSGFPVGTYSFSTFLDTVTTDCTPDPSTWTCFPYTIYNTDHSKALTTFNWIIKPASKVDTYSISSEPNPFAIEFANAPMKIVDKGGVNERYHFQVTLDKTVVPSAAISDDGAAATCIYNSTTFTGYMYTKRAKNYPNADTTAANMTYTPWPFAVRAEQTIAGGEDIPNCYRTTDGQLGDQFGNTTAMDPTTLCSCLYRNYLTPIPT